MEDEEEWITAAPPPAMGYKHQVHLALVTNEVIGRRLQYRWRSSTGWLSGVITQATTGKAKGARTFSIHCTDDGVLPAIQLNLSEHGVSRRWVLWEWAPPLRGSPYVENVPIAVAPLGWKFVATPPAAANDVYLKSLKRKAKKGIVLASSRKVMYRFEPPVDWHIGEVTDVEKKSKKIRSKSAQHGYVKVVYQSKSHGQDSQYHALEVGSYGVQGRWVVLKPKQAALTAQ